MALKYITYVETKGELHLFEKISFVFQLRVICVDAHLYFKNCV